MYYNLVHETLDVILRRHLPIQLPTLFSQAHLQVKLKVEQSVRPAGKVCLASYTD